MSQPSKPNHPTILPTQVWAGLALERRTEVIRLMAHLAFNLVNAQSDLFNQEAAHVVRPDPQQNSCQPS